MADRTLTVKIVGDDRSLLRAFTRSSKASSSFGKNVERASRGAAVATVGFRGLGRSIAFASAAFLGGAGFTAGVGAAVKAASDLNEQINKSNVIFGDQAEAVIAFSRSTADAIGLSQRAALEAAGSFGAMFSTLGLGETEMAAMSKRLVTLGADLASFTNEDPSDMLDRLRSGLAGEAEPLRRFGILISAARVQQEAYRIGLAKAGDELTEQQKVQARYSLILRDSAKAQGDFARTSDSFANAQRKLRANVENLGAQIGGVLLPVFARATGALSSFLSSLGRNEAFTSFLNSVGSTVSRLSEAFQARIPQIREVLGSIVDPLREFVIPVLLDFAGIVQRMWTNVLGVFSANSDRIRAILTDLGEILRNVWTVARPTIVFLFEKALPTAIAIAIRVLEKVTGVVKVMSETFIRAVGFIIRAIDLFLGGLSTLADAASRLPFVGDKFVGVADKINGAREGLRGFAAELDAIDGKQVNVEINIQTSRNGSTRRPPGRPGSTRDAVEEETDEIVDALDSQEEGAKTIESAADAATKATNRAVTAAEKARIAQERLRKERETRIRRRNRRQFEALGLTGEGEERVPSVAALTRRLGTLQQSIKGTVLDTAKTRARLRRIAKVLSGDLGKVGRDVRRAILQMFSDISSALSGGDAGDRAGPLTKTSGLNTKKILEGLGLTPDQVRELRGRLSKVTGTPGDGRTSRTRRSEGLTDRGTGGAIVVESHTTINLDGDQVARVVTRNQQKQRSRNPRQKRGPNRGGR